ncbi:MAG: LysR family transcriptional regulator [Chromatiaceae bacterium]|nr:LysR family transcriptional regulator [Gammaproteobacteria bacterium]MCP5318197.1 LysR family transcriptional regulator [Chromatiaceae bacterium]MCW5584960.1 LysR family transcriptional regulator [Chromatiales bacterium]MCP5435060.1 LysR family transcriptional regulator [Chromatiaceae bacterium]HOP18376.1 LysR family transcriptional regulator [Gammaproteobacteria bacterium]
MADRRLQVFHTVARLLSFTKAAETLHMTQPAVTFQVRQLEEYFNTRLFDRTHNRISLTEAGARVFQYSDKIFELYGEMENAVREMTGEISGSLTIGASTTIAEYMLPALLGDFRAKYPDVSIHLKVSNTDGIVSMVENNTIDLGVVEAPVSNKNLVVDECRRDNLVAIVPPGHPKADRKRITLDELLEYPFICREEGSGTREVIAEYMNTSPDCNACMNVAMELGSPEAVKGAVEAGMGISVVSNATIQKELRLGTLVAIELDPPLERPFSFVHQKQKFRVRVMEELLEFARAYCEAHRGK